MHIFLLQAEVASLSPKIRYHEHERVLLNVENVILKQKLAALTKAQRLKEGKFILNVSYTKHIFIIPKFGEVFAL